MKHIQHSLVSLYFQPNEEFVTMLSPWVTSLICSVCLQVLSPCYWILGQSLEQTLPANLPSEDSFIPLLHTLSLSYYPQALSPLPPPPHTPFPASKSCLSCVLPSLWGISNSRSLSPMPLSGKNGEGSIQILTVVKERQKPSDKISERQLDFSAIMIKPQAAHLLQSILLRVAISFLALCYILRVPLSPWSL